MELKNLIYTKGESQQSERQALSKRVESTPHDSVNIVNESVIEVPNYSKVDGVLSQSLVFVLSGGSETERSFFKELILNRNIHTVKVLFLTKTNQGLQPYQMEQIWRDALNNKYVMIDRISYTLASIDKSFLITDVDEFEEQLEKILSEKAPDDWGQWIISNPSFEIWLYHCYGDNISEDLGSLADIEVAHRSQYLSSLCHELFSGGMNPVKSFEYMREGIVRSKSSYREKDSGIPELCCTQMYYVAEYILDELERKDNEFTKFLEEKRRHVAMYKQCVIADMP